MSKLHWTLISFLALLKHFSHLLVCGLLGPSLLSTGLGAPQAQGRCPSVAHTWGLPYPPCSGPSCTRRPHRAWEQPRADGNHSDGKTAHSHLCHWPVN